MALIMIIKKILRFLFRPNRIHIEKFYKASLSSSEPGLTGWSSRRETTLRVIIEGKEYLSQRISRPDAPHAFYLGLPNLNGIDGFTVEYLRGSNWVPFRKFLRPAQKNTSDDIDDFPQLRKAVFIHAYYPDILKEILSQLKNIKDHFDAYIFIPEGSPMHEAYKTGQTYDIPSPEILVGESKGRDMGGFLQLARHVLEAKKEYDACLVVHTKKSPQFSENMATAWRTILVNSLVGSEAVSNSALKLLFSEENINLVGSQDFLHHYTLTRGVGNYSRYVQLCRLFNLPVQNTDFIAGTMFWIKFSVLKEHLTSDRLTKAIDLLEQGAYPEPSYAHAWERFIGRLATSGGGKIKGLQYPSEFLELSIK